MTTTFGLVIPNWTEISRGVYAGLTVVTTIPVETRTKSLKWIMMSDQLEGFTVVGGPGEEEAVLGAVGQEDGEDVLGPASELAEDRGHL